MFARAGASANRHWIVCLAMVFVVSLLTEALAEVPGKQLFTEHCQMCHSGAKAMGGFTVTSLKEDFTDKQNLERWLTVLEQLKDGNMPPKEKPRPPIDDVKIVMDWITTQAEKAESVRRETEGRVVMRRLNRAEYANTMRDLLGVEVDLADLLPLDTSTNGFDNNAEQLHTSSFLMRNYLDAADRVLDEAIANEPEPWIQKKRFDIREEKSVKATGSVYRHTDDGVAIFATWESANIRVTMWNFRSHVRGKYRFRISGYGFQSEGKPITFRVTAGTLKEVTEERLIDYFAVPADKPTVIEFTEQLEPENRIRILAEGLPAIPPAVEKIGADKYTGPGLVIQWVDVEGPILESWPPPSHKAIFGDLKLTRIAPERFEVVSSQPMIDAERILRDFARRAFRRNITDVDLQPFLMRVQSKLAQNYSFEQAMRVGLKGVLVSPDFLFLREQGPKLDDFALASRLSYFLWSSMPDEELFELASANRLHEPEVLREQVERLLRDPKAKAFNTNFTGQWLSLRAIDATMPDGTLYPEYDDILKTSMLKETSLFFDEVLKNDLPVTHFVSSDFSFLNARLAKHYGIPGIEGMEMRKVTLPSESHRGGLLTMGSVLKVTANGTTTSPIIRGSWVLERILGTPPAKPPADVGAIEPDIRGATTIREQLAKHRNVESCASCHRKIDPPGFALESFDVIGGWRDHYRATGEPREVNGRRVRFWNGPAVDPGDELADGRSFRNIDEYKKLILEDKDQLARNLTEKLLAYGTGAVPNYSDKLQIETIISRLRDKNYGFKSLIHEIVQSPLFQSK
jgi:mono/diheme cytochrome c family protein